MNYGGIALVTAGALFMHAGFTGVSPLADLKSILTTGKVASVGAQTFAPGQAGNPQALPGTAPGSNLIAKTPGVGGSPGGQPSGPDPLPGG